MRPEDSVNSTTPPEPVDTRAMFRPVGAGLVRLLAGLSAGDWLKPTLAGPWNVQDVVAHLVDTRLRRLSFQRDGLVPPPPATPLTTEREFVRFINTLNAEWIVASKRLSPRILTDLFEWSNAGFANWVESQPFDAPALFAVSWAGELESAGWFDLGREFTELWHHQEQIRIAVGAPSLSDARFLRAVLAIAVRGLPHAFRTVPARRGAAMVLDISGPSGDAWTLTREDAGWTLSAGAPVVFATRIRLRDTTAWKLLFNALPEAEARSQMGVEGDGALADALLLARSVVV